MKILSFVLVLFALSSSANAQLLWKISGNNLAKPSYLFGSHHLMDKDSIPSFDKILARAKEADAVVGEIDMSDMASVKKIQMAGSMLLGKTCKDLYSEADYAFLDKELKSMMGLGIEQLGMLKPIVLGTVFTLYSYMKTTGASRQPEPIDLIFQKELGQKGKKVIGLETAEFQVDLLFNSIPLDKAGGDAAERSQREG